MTPQNIHTNKTVPGVTQLTQTKYTERGPNQVTEHVSFRRRVKLRGKKIWLPRNTHSAAVGDIEDTDSVNNHVSSIHPLYFYTQQDGLRGLGRTSCSDRTTPGSTCKGPGEYLNPLSLRNHNFSYLCR